MEVAAECRSRCEPKEGASTPARRTARSTMLAIVAVLPDDALRMVAAVRTCVRSPAQSGQRIPTGLCVMQSGHIVRPHDEHCTRVSRPGALAADCILYTSDAADDFNGDDSRGRRDT